MSQNLFYMRHTLQMKAPLLLLDCSTHCVKSYSVLQRYKCVCDFSKLLAKINKQLAQEHRESSFLGLLAAILNGNDLRITSVSLLGSSISRDMLDNDIPVPVLSKILGPDVPVQSFLHTTLLFNLVTPACSSSPEHSPNETC